MSSWTSDMWSTTLSSMDTAAHYPQRWPQTWHHKATNRQQLHNGNTVIIFCTTTYLRYINPLVRLPLHQGLSFSRRIRGTIAFKGGIRIVLSFSDSLFNDCRASGNMLKNHSTGKVTATLIMDYNVINFKHLDAWKREVLHSCVR